MSVGEMHNKKCSNIRILQETMGDEKNTVCISDKFIDEVI